MQSSKCHPAHQKMNRSASARLCATLFVTSSSLSVNLSSCCSDCHPASRSEVKSRREVGFTGRPTGVCVCVVWSGGGVYESSVSVWVLQEADVRGN